MVHTYETSPLHYCWKRSTTYTVILFPSKVWIKMETTLWMDKVLDKVLYKVIVTKALYKVLSSHWTRYVSLEFFFLLYIFIPQCQIFYDSCLFNQNPNFNDSRLQFLSQGSYVPCEGMILHVKGVMYHHQQRDDIESQITSSSLHIPLLHLLPWCHPPWVFSSTFLCGFQFTPPLLFALWESSVYGHFVHLTILDF